MLLKKKLIIALSSFAVIPMIVLGAWVYLYAQKEIQTARIAQLESLADSNVQTIAEFFEERRKISNQLNKLHIFTLLHLKIIVPGRNVS